jgi:Photoprotection regulator fluorescence recovery protein
LGSQNQVAKISKIRHLKKSTPIDSGFNMQAIDTGWSKAEQQLARAAFDRAYEREMAALVATVREKSGSITELADLWQLHDFLSAKRHELDGKYDYRYSVLVFVFATLVREGWLHLDELAGLEQDKLSKIGALTRM